MHTPTTKRRVAMPSISSCRLKPFLVLAVFRAATLVVSGWPGFRTAVSLQNSFGGVSGTDSPSPFINKMNIINNFYFSIIYISFQGRNKIMFKYFPNFIYYIKHVSSKPDMYESLLPESYSLYFWIVTYSKGAPHVSVLGWCSRAWRWDPSGLSPCLQRCPYFSSFVPDFPFLFHLERDE